MLRVMKTCADIVRPLTELETLRRNHGGCVSALAEIRHALEKLRRAGVPIRMQPLDDLVLPRIDEIRARLKVLGAPETEEKESNGFVA